VSLFPLSALLLPHQYEFIVEDVCRLEARVKYMHIIDYGTAVMLQEIADIKATEDFPERTIKKLRSVACDYFHGAQRTFPTHQDTIDRIKEIESYSRSQTIPYFPPS
jgi:hypothetical protein